MKLCGLEARDTHQSPLEKIHLNIQEPAVQVSGKYILLLAGNTATKCQATVSETVSKIVNGWRVTVLTISEEETTSHFIKPFLFFQCHKEEVHEETGAVAEVLVVVDGEHGEGIITEVVLCKRKPILNT